MMESKRYMMSKNLMGKFQCLNAVFLKKINNNKTVLATVYLNLYVDSNF